MWAWTIILLYLNQTKEKCGGRVLNKLHWTFPAMSGKVYDKSSSLSSTSCCCSFGPIPSQYTIFNTHLMLSKDKILRHLVLCRSKILFHSEKVVGVTSDVGTKTTNTLFNHTWWLPVSFRTPHASCLWLLHKNKNAVRGDPLKAPKINTEFRRIMYRGFTYGTVIHVCLFNWSFVTYSL